MLPLRELRMLTHMLFYIGQTIEDPLPKKIHEGVSNEDGMCSREDG